MSLIEIDNFINIINKAIDDGNINILMKAITHYENKIPIKYITIGKTILTELLTEKMEEVLISDLFK